ITDAALVTPSDVYQAIGVFVGQRFEDDAVKDAEDRGVRSDAESQRKNDGECEDWSPQKRSGAVAQVLPERFQPAPAANVIAAFSVPAQVAETFQGGGSRLVRRHPALDFRLRFHLDVDAQFFFNVPQDAFAPEQGAQPRHENVEPFHHQPPQTAFLTFAMARASRSQLSSSALSCLLPA